MGDTQVKREIAILGSAMFVLILCGCGGGGGGPAAAQAPGPPPSGAITTGSALTVAGRSVDAALLSGSFGDITDFVGLTAVSTSDPRTLGVAKLSGNVGLPVASQVPVGPETTPCLVEGSVTLSGDIANPLSITPGDFLDFLWNGCDDDLGQIIDGLIGMTFTDFEGTLLAGRILLGVSLTAENFQVTEDGSFNLVDGDLDLTIDSRNQTETIFTTLGSSFVVSNSRGTTTLTDFSSMVTENLSVFPSNISLDASGTISSTQFNGAVNYDTPVSFESTGDGFPYAGEMLVSGAGNARIKIIAISEINVRVEADFNGDGAADATIDTTWEALING